MRDEDFDYVSPPMGPGRTMLLVDPDKYAALQAERDALRAKVEPLQVKLANLMFMTQGELVEASAAHDRLVLEAAWERVENTFFPVAIALNEPVMKTIKDAIMGES